MIAPCGRKLKLLSVESGDIIESTNAESRSISPPPPIDRSVLQDCNWIRRHITERVRRGLVGFFLEIPWRFLQISDDEMEKRQEAKAYAKT